MKAETAGIAAAADASIAKLREEGELRSKTLDMLPEIAKFFLKVGVVSSASGFRHLIRFFNCRRQKRFVCLLLIPRATAWRAQFGDGVAQTVER